MPRNRQGTRQGWAGSAMLSLDRRSEQPHPPHRTGADRLDFEPRSRPYRVGRGADMQKVDIQSLVQRILLSVFALALVAGIGGFYLLLRNAALTQAEKD